MPQSIGKALFLTGVVPGEVGCKSIPSTSIGGAPAEEGLQGAVSNRLQSHPQPVVAVQLSAQRGGDVGGEHEEYGF